MEIKKTITKNWIASTWGAFVYWNVYFDNKFHSSVSTEEEAKKVKYGDKSKNIR